MLSLFETFQVVEDRVVVDQVVVDQGQAAIQV